MLGKRQLDALKKAEPAPRPRTEWEFTVWHIDKYAKPVVQADNIERVIKEFLAEFGSFLVYGGGALAVVIRRMHADGEIKVEPLDDRDFFKAVHVEKEFDNG